MIGHSGAAFGEYDYECEGPLEINGSRWVQILTGVMIQGQAGISIMMFNANVTFPVGVIESVTYYACPDLSVSDWPNPPGAWKNHLEPAKCKSIGSKPTVIGGPEPPPPPPPVEPSPVVPGLAGPDGLTPGVTNPGNGNPVAAMTPDGR